MEVVQRFARRVLWTSLVLVAVLGAVAAPWHLALAKGLWLGGGAACGAFLLRVRMASRIQSGNGLVSFAIISASFVRLAMYAVVLWAAHSFDPAGWRGFAGAVAGISVVYVVTVAIGYIGSDLREEPK